MPVKPTYPSTLLSPEDLRRWHEEKTAERRAVEIAHARVALSEAMASAFSGTHRPVSKRAKLPIEVDVPEPAHAAEALKAELEGLGWVVTPSTREHRHLWEHNQPVITVNTWQLAPTAAAG